MYNRYIPQSDGTHRRKPTQETAPPPQPISPKASHPPAFCEPTHCHKPPQNLGIGNFFKQILPQNLDIGDLIVILLLLLMAADDNADENSALLTLALYLFL